jgi:hypothetical protein
MATATRNPAKGRALRDVVGGDRDKAGNLVDAIPAERFGTDRGRLLRKLVLIAIAKSADPDGTGAYPCMETVARRCLVTIEAVRLAINWLVKHDLLKVESRAAPIITSKFGRPNRYTILFPKPEHIQMELVEANEGASTTTGAASTTMEVASTNRKATMTCPLTVNMTVYEDAELASSSVQEPHPPILNSEPHSDDEEQLQPSSSSKTTPLPITPVQSSKVTVAAAALDEDAILSRLWEYYVAATGKEPISNTLTAGRRKLGKTRLHECLLRTKGNYEKGEKLMELAIDGIVKNDWAMGRDPKTNGQCYCDWERHIFKSEEMMERLWNS